MRGNFCLQVKAVSSVVTIFSWKVRWSFISWNHLEVYSTSLQRSINKAPSASDGYFHAAIKAIGNFQSGYQGQ